MSCLNCTSFCLASKLHEMSSFVEHVELIVGGLRYTVAVSDIQQHPESFFAKLLKEEWKPALGEPITIDRDGMLFKHVNAFLVYGNLPRKPDGAIALDASEVERVKEEADFYNLPTLVEECNSNSLPSALYRKLAAHATIRNYIGTIKCANSPDLVCEYASSDPHALVNVLSSAWMPFCLVGVMDDFYNIVRHPLFKRSTLQKPKVKELLAEATQSAFGQGTETIVDTTVRNSFEIPADRLNAKTLTEIKRYINVQPLAAKMKLELRPYKLVIYKTCGHFDQHRDTVRGDNHIGTLVVILNSAYTGGELEVTHGGKTEVVTGPYKWVAMYGDCLHKINPVTSGTRVSLIYDIYATHAVAPVRTRVLHWTSVLDSEDEDAEENGQEQSDEEIQEPHKQEEDDEEDEDVRGLANYLRTLRRRGEIKAETTRGIDSPQQQQICAALDKELDTYGTVVICLAHLYPACQSNPSFLKGGDLALYELLRDKYEVSVEAVSVYLSHYDDVEDGDLVVATMMSNIERNCENRCARRAAASVDVLFVIPAHLSADHVLDYTPFIGHTGNECQAEETVYIVGGLQVRKL